MPDRLKSKSTLSSLGILFAVSYQKIICVNCGKRVTYMLHFDSFDQDVVLLVLIVVIEESAIKHDWVMFLRDLIRLW